MFLRSDQGLEQGGGAAALTFGRAGVSAAPAGWLDRARTRAATIDWTPDLGARIGTAQWYRGAASCAALIAATCYFSPGFHRTVIGDVPPALVGAPWEETRSLSIAPLAWGANSGRRLAANDLVRPLAETPERPVIELAATLGNGDDISGMLERAGIARAEAGRVASLIGNEVALSSIKPGTQFALTLGRRASRADPRPLESLHFRARFDLNLSINRAGSGLALDPQPIAIDNTPLRIRGLVGPSLYRSARAAGAPAKAVEAYIRAIAEKVSVGRDVSADNAFDIIVERARAATGEVRLGQLLFAGLEHDGRKLQLVRWERDGRGEWLDPKGVGERRGLMTMPVQGHLTSGFGFRRHPILGFVRMHKGLDIGAPYGTPIRAAMDGVVSFAGRNAGYGNFVKLTHGSGLATGYGHMSRILVRPGTRVSQGQIIGAVGSTGLSTGAHLHYELWRNGAAINPASVSFTTVAQLSGDALRQFRARVSSLLAVRPDTQ
ncbi:MAG: M23 family metallopeptidase [Sphingomonas sp.]